MQRLHYFASAGLGCHIDRRTNERHCIMNMHDIDIMLTDNPLNISNSPSAVKCRQRQQQLLKLRHFVKLGVITNICNNLVSVTLQQLPLILGNSILTAAILVSIMNDEDILFCWITVINSYS